MGAIRCKVLIVGCAVRASAEFCAHLGSHGMTVVAQNYGDELRSTIEVFAPDLAVVELVDSNVATTIDWVRGASDLPVLLLVPHGSSSALRIAAFREGADDVLEHPVHADELAVRVRAILRRRNVDNLFRVNDIVIDEAGHMAWRGDNLLCLTATEFGILDMLARNADVVITKRQLLSAVWGFDDYDVNVVEVHVCALRRKLEQFGPRMIHTVRSLGYVIRTCAATVVPTLEWPAERPVAESHPLIRLTEAASAVSAC